jgi:hypothetical protein
MRLGRTIAAVAGSLAVTLTGLFLGISPWLWGLNDGRHAWSLATKTDFWSGLGLVVVGLVALVGYRQSLMKELEWAGILSRTPVVDAVADESRAEGSAAPLTDDLLLALATSLVKDMSADERASAPVGREDVAQPEQHPVTDETVVQAATQLVKDIEASHGSAAAKPTEGERESLSEADIVHLAADLLLELQRSRTATPVMAGEEGVHE